jgi:hypothetical protein
MKLYEIVFSGQLVPGAKLEKVQANLAKLFQADAQRIALLFSGRRLVLKNSLDQANAEKYRSTLERAGAHVDVREMPGQVVLPVEVEVEEVELAPPPDEPAWTRRAAPSPAAPRAQTKSEQTSTNKARDVYTAAFVDVEAPDFQLSESGMDVQDPKADPVPPRLDLSGLSLAPLGSDMGQLKSTEGALVPDTSHLKLV